jgi:hypothetical protein
MREKDIDRTSRGRTSEFPKGDWVLLALGEVSRSRTNPLFDSVGVRLAQINIDNSDAAPTAFLSKDVPVSLLPHLKVGTIWRDGTPAATVLGAARTRMFRGVENMATSRVVTLFDGANRQTLPPTKSSDTTVVNLSGTFPWSCYERNDQGQNAIAVTVADQPVELIIPCWEILRFYFCSSGILSEEILRYGLMPDNNLYDDAMSRMVDGCCRLVLRRNIPSGDAATVLRIAFDKTAAYQARSCALGILTQLVRDVPAYPKLCLPFSGSSDLQCLTRRCQTTDGRWIDVVVQIQSCTASFPQHEPGWRGFREVSSLVGELMNRQNASSADDADGMLMANRSGKSQFLTTVLVALNESLSTGANTFEAAADYLNQRGIPTQNGKTWQPNNVRQTLENAMRRNKTPKTRRCRRRISFFTS